MEHEIGQTRVRLEGTAYIVPVVFGEEETQPLLGMVTLEIFRLGIDPVSERLTPVPGLLMAHKGTRRGQAWPTTK
jgi:predicted aspartyl protease